MFKKLDTNFKSILRESENYVFFILAFLIIVCSVTLKIKSETQNFYGTNPNENRLDIDIFSALLNIWSTRIFSSLPSSQKGSPFS